MFVWKKLASAKWEDAWLERLAFIEPTRLVVTGLPGRKSLRIEAYGLTEREAIDLVTQFGGQARNMPEVVLSTPEPRKPLAIRGRFLIVTSKEAAAECQVAPSESREVLIIPAAMAFGTGEHATTASCLRLLCDLSTAYKKSKTAWDFLDLGTGSGILAIAAKKLGARKVEGCDFDPHAVRTAKENVKINSVQPLPIRKTDVLAWTPPRQWEVVAANLFSQVLIQAAPSIVAAITPGGKLILSGILRSQEAEVVTEFQQRSLKFLRQVRKGKWVSLLAELPE
jgi:ribosomal protein L11 methyltransferase